MDGNFAWTYFSDSACCFGFADSYFFRLGGGGSGGSEGRHYYLLSYDWAVIPNSWNKRLKIIFQFLLIFGFCINLKFINAQIPIYRRQVLL